MKINKWLDPLNIANFLSKKEQHIALCFSGEKRKYSGERSFLAWGADDICCDNLDALEKSNNPDEYWFGYFSYESFHNTTLEKSPINTNRSYFFKAKNVLVFNHNEQNLEYLGNDNIEELLQEVKNIEEAEIKNITLASNMTKDKYLEKVEHITSNIKEGNYYQVNLTRKFFGSLDSDNVFSIFANLSKCSPATYSSFLKLEDNFIISSSPERFLKIDDDGKINSRPIKGTAPISSSATDLFNSKKDRAENLMIVDLMRNDLAKSAQKNSVTVESLFDIDSYKTLHHMSSSINALQKENISILEVIKNAFPPASMTGAPKKAVMAEIEVLEKQQRGIYSGAIGYFKGDKKCDFSVTIRTVILQKKQENKYNFEFQVGGGIIYDSTPEKEWEETIVKARGVCNALNIDVKRLEEL